MNIKQVIGMSLVVVGAVGCTDNGHRLAAEQRVDVALDQYNAAARSRIETVCQCFMPERHDGDTAACVDEYFAPKTLAECEQAVALCYNSGYSSWLDCRAEADRELVNCLSSCPTEQIERDFCTIQRAQEWETCDRRRPAALVAGLETCQNGEPFVCDDDAATPDAGDDGPSVDSSQVDVDAIRERTSEPCEGLTAETAPHPRESTTFELRMSLNGEFDESLSEPDEDGVARLDFEVTAQSVRDVPEESRYNVNFLTGMVLDPLPDEADTPIMGHVAAYTAQSLRLADQIRERFAYRQQVTSVGCRIPGTHPDARTGIGFRWKSLQRADQEQVSILYASLNALRDGGVEMTDEVPAIIEDVGWTQFECPIYDAMPDEPVEYLAQTVLPVFLLSDGQQVAVPAGTEDWFEIDGQRYHLMVHTARVHHQPDDCGRIAFSLVRADMYLDEGR